MPNKQTQSNEERALQVQPSSEVALALDKSELGMIPLDMAERLLVMGDLSQLAPQERLLYYQNFCQSLGLNAIARPFEYLYFNNKLTLYATKECAAQLREQRHVSFTKLETVFEAGLLITRVEATLPDGRVDVDEGAVSVEGLRGDALANARLKAITKAKRRVTLSICGLGTLDETEVDTIQGARRVSVGEAHSVQVVEGEAVVVETVPVPSPKAQRASQRAQEPPKAAEPTTAAQDREREFRALYSGLELVGWQKAELAAEYAKIVPDKAKFSSLDEAQQVAVLALFTELDQEPSLGPAEGETAKPAEAEVAV